MNILITGGSGFIGANLIKKLLDSTEHNIIATYNRTRVPIVNERLRTIKINFAEFEDICRLFDECKFDAVIHTAAVVSFRKKHHPLMFKVNYEGTKHLVNFMIERGIERLIYVSSVAALSKTEKKAITEEDLFNENENHSIYGKTKFLGELEVWRGQEEGLKVTVINPVIVLGSPVCGWKRSSAGLFYRVHKGISFFPPGTTGWVSINDVVNILAKILAEQENSVGKKWIVSAENRTWKDVISIMAEHLNAKKPTKTIPASFLRLYAKIAKILPEKILPLSPEEATSSALNLRYDNSKIRTEFYPEFEPIDKVIIEASRKFLKDNG